ncbi:MAG: ABC transporter substrate-binding protein [Sedimentisphaeraceae bacterium JB056]
MHKHLISAFFVIVLALSFVCGCKEQSKPQVDKVVIMSPHSDNIKYELERGFKKYYLDKYGKDVEVDWRNIGGGGSAILSYIRNVYSRSESSGIDILYGAGENPHQYLAAEGLLQAYQPADDYLAAVPEVFGGSRLYDKDHLWHGTVLSSFGFLYNKELLSQLNLNKPESWSDLGKEEYCGQIMLADPSQSSSIAAAYEMILQSESDWHKGWQKLLNLLANAKKFTSSSSAATNAPVIGEAVIAACIDYYGALAVVQAPDKLGYVSPKNGTGFTPDPISILKNPPDSQTAIRFVDYVLSFEGQALWGLKPGEELGPEQSCLNRPPIRKDFYNKYADKMPEWLVKPYSSDPINVDADLRTQRYDVMIELVRAAAIDAGGSLHKVKTIIDSTDNQSLKDKFYELPEEITAVEQLKEVHGKLADDTYRQQLRRKWAQFYREKYADIISQSQQ